MSAQDPEPSPDKAPSMAASECTPILPPASVRSNRRTAKKTKASTSTIREAADGTAWFRRTSAAVASATRRSAHLPCCSSLRANFTSSRPVENFGRSLRRGAKVPVVSARECPAHESLWTQFVQKPGPASADPRFQPTGIKGLVPVEIHQPKASSQGPENSQYFHFPVFENPVHRPTVCRGPASARAGNRRVLPARTRGEIPSDDDFP